MDKGVFILIDLPGDNMFLMAVCRSGGVLCVLLRLRFFHLLRLVLVTEFCQHIILLCTVATLFYSMRLFEGMVSLVSCSRESLE